ncbi:MAG: septum formation initiator family protein [Bdellovibrionales bacterium]
MRYFLLVAIGLLIVGYLFYHTIKGERGWFTMLRLQREVEQAESTLDHLQKERVSLEAQTQRLKEESLDPDLLDEKSRELLNYSKPNEIVIMTPEKEDTEEE